MSKSLSQIRDDARKIIFETDANNSHFSNAQLTIWANEAYRLMAVALKFVPITSRDYTADTDPITLNNAFITLRAGRVYDNGTGKYIELTPIDEVDLIAINPDYENAPVGKPKYIVRLGTFSVRLYPPPDSDVDGQTLRLTCLESPTPMADDNDTPDLPEPCHDMIPHYIASKALLSIGRTEEGVAQLQLYRSGVKGMTGIVNQFSTQRDGLRWEVGDHDLA